MLKKNRNVDNDNDKLQCFTKTFNSQKYKKCSPGKYALLLNVAVSIRWISIRFDFYTIVYWSRILEDYGLMMQYNYQICSTLSVYGEVMYFKLYSVFSEPFMKYCSVKDCNSASSCENEILHKINEYIVDFIGKQFSI